MGGHLKPHFSFGCRSDSGESSVVIWADSDSSGTALPGSPAEWSLLTAPFTVVSCPGGKVWHLEIWEVLPLEAVGPLAQGDS